MNLITGCNSFLSRRLAMELPKDDVLGAGRSDWRNSLPYTDYSALFDSKLEFENVFHIAAYVPRSLNATEDGELFESNVRLTDSICNNVLFNKMVFSSSVSVYGQSDESVISEKSGYNQPGSYGLSKLWAENIIARQDSFSIIRFSSIYGEGMKENTLIPNYVNQALSNGVIEVWGKGLRNQNYIHCSDAARLMLAGAEFKGNGIFLGVDISSYTNIAIAEIIADITGAKINHIGEDNSKSMFYNNEWTRDTLNWKPIVGIEEGISEYIKWKKNQY